MMIHDDYLFCRRRLCILRGYLREKVDLGIAWGFGLRGHLGRDKIIALVKDITTSHILSEMLGSSLRSALSVKHI